MSTTPSTDIALPSSAPTLSQQIVLMEDQFRMAAPRGIEAKQLVRDALTALRQNPELAECDAKSVLGGLMTMAQLGLRVGVLGHGWLLPFRDWKTKQKHAQLIIGYQGLVELGYRSNKIKSLSARTVHANDHFHVEYGVDERLEHRPATGDRGPVTGYYAVVRFLPDGHSFYYMTRPEAEVYRDRYAMAKNRQGEVVGPWKSEFDGMAKKTCIRQLSKLMPKGTELSVALMVDDTVRMDIDPHMPAELASVHVERPASDETVHVEVEDIAPADEPTDPNGGQ